MDYSCKTSRQICPHCYKKTDVFIDAGDETSVLGKYTCSHCGKKFTLLEASEAKTYKNTGYYPGQDTTSPFYLEGVNPRSKGAIIYKILVGILLTFAPILYSRFLYSDGTPISDLCLRVIMGDNINTSPFEAFARFGLFLTVIGSILYFIGKICKKLLFRKLKLNREINIDRQININSNDTRIP